MAMTALERGTIHWSEKTAAFLEVSETTVEARFFPVIL
jgi:hypothetical protein